MVEYINNNRHLSFNTLLALIAIAFGAYFYFDDTKASKKDIEKSKEELSQEHGQLNKKFDRCFDKRFFKLLETEKSILYDRLEQCNESYDILLDDYFEVL